MNTYRYLRVKIRSIGKVSNPPMQGKHDAYQFLLDHVRKDFRFYIASYTPFIIITPNERCRIAKICSLRRIWLQSLIFAAAILLHILEDGVLS